jgi:uncharacterized protein (DUF1800 family)
MCRSESGRSGQNGIYDRVLAATLLTAFFLCGCGSGIVPAAAKSSAASTGAPSTASVQQASRLLDQSTFGPTSEDITKVESIGMNAYLDQQIAAGPTLLAPVTCVNSVGCAQSEWWQTVLTAPDQLRQRVAFALSEVWVTSAASVDAHAVLSTYNVLIQDAFTNWRIIMQDATTSTGMGLYLNMLNSGYPPAGQIANENYARELMQLMSLGVYRLNEDGSVKTDALGNSIPTYTQDQVQAFARAFTGWTYANADGSRPTAFPNSNHTFSLPMQAVELGHDPASKTLIDGRILPANQTAEQDLKDALDTIFQDENLPPFISRILIQHLVTGSPSPGYVARVAGVFTANGNGVRGDMPSVIRAILLDPEARAGDTNPTQNSGHLREGLLYITAPLRALNFQNIVSPTDSAALEPYNYLSDYSITLDETPLAEPSVFSFYSPQYVIPSTALNAPEFGLENTATAAARLTIADCIATNNLFGFTADLGATSPLGKIAVSPTALVDALSVLFLNGQMPDQMRSVLVDAITPIADPASRVSIALYLVLSSSQYKIAH